MPSKNTITSDADNMGALVDAFGMMIRRLPGSTQDDTGGVATSLGHVPLAFFNMSFLSQPTSGEAEFMRTLTLARTRAATCAQPSFIGFCRAWAPGNADALIAEAGLAVGTNLTGMASDRLAPCRRPAPALDYRLVEDDITVARDLGVINALADGMPPEDCTCVEESALWAGQSFGVVGYVDGRAVSATAAFVVGEMIYIAYVATLPEAYGRGYAEAVMRHAIARAREAVGNRRVWLHATDMGAPLYRSMGFETGATLPLLSVS